MLNSKTPVTDKQLGDYKELTKKFASTWTEVHGLRSVTPYLHIMFKHSYAYLKQYRSLRDWSQEAFEASHKRHKQYYSKTNYGGCVHLKPCAPLVLPLLFCFHVCTQNMLNAQPQRQETK